VGISWTSNVASILGFGLQTLKPLEKLSNNVASIFVAPCLHRGTFGF
jgi:hypothetical protein